MSASGTASVECAARLAHPAMRLFLVAEDPFRHGRDASEAHRAIRLFEGELLIRLLAASERPPRHDQIEQLLAAEAVGEEIVENR